MAAANSEAQSLLHQETCPVRLSIPFAVGIGKARQSNNSIGPYKRYGTEGLSHFGSHSASEPLIFRGLKGDFDPHTSLLATKKYPSFTKSRTCGGLKKRPLLPRNT